MNGSLVLALASCPASALFLISACRRRLSIALTVLSVAERHPAWFDLNTRTMHLGHLTISARDFFVASGFAAMTRVACLCLQNDAVPMQDSPTKKLQSEYQRSKTRMHQCRRPTKESGWLLRITCLACKLHGTRNTSFGTVRRHWRL